MDDIVEGLISIPIWFNFQVQSLSRSMNIVFSK